MPKTPRAHDILIRIKRAIVLGHYVFSQKASDELDADGLEPHDALEAVLNAVAVTKVLRSQSPYASNSGEKLYVIIGCN